MHRSAELAQVMQSLNDHGLLLKQDKSLASVVTIITGGPLATSWWSHPRGKVIFRCLSELADHPDVVVTKLVSGKDTFVHRHLWPALLAVATAHEPWQFAGLSAGARSLFKRVESAGKLLASGPIAKELQTRLLVHGEQIHTESGAHKNCLESWQAWSSRVKFKGDASAEEGRRELEKAICAIGGTGKEFPWRTVKRRG